MVVLLVRAETHTSSRITSRRLTQRTDVPIHSTTTHQGSCARWPCALRHRSSVAGRRVHRCKATASPNNRERPGCGPVLGASATDLHPRIYSCLRQFEERNEADLSIGMRCLFGCKRRQLPTRSMRVNPRSGPVPSLQPTLAVGQLSNKHYILTEDFSVPRFDKSRELFIIFTPPLITKGGYRVLVFLLVF